MLHEPSSETAPAVVGSALDNSGFTTISATLLAAAQDSEIIVMAGAGVSAGRPSAVPGWKPLNEAIVHALSQQLERALERPGWLAQLTAFIDARRTADQFPPEYQAQVIEEMCGDRYFHALQSLDVDVINAAHEGIAVLAARGAVKAVITTNFDCLIERALERHGVRFDVAFDDAGFSALAARLRAGTAGPLPVIKIHGSVSDHRSMIDTLKQRKRGRSRYVQECLDPLHADHWLYLGFSAADLDSNPDYLGLRTGAALSRGATYVSFPGNPALGSGARLLMDAYGARGEHLVANTGALLGALAAAIGVTSFVTIPEEGDRGHSQFQIKLAAWAGALSTPSAALCLAAILEALGAAEPAARILDRIVRKELTQPERETADFRLVQLHYGRLGAAWSRFIAVPDLNGVASNISVETTQSLMRVQDTELGFAARSWLACLWLWTGHGDHAMATAVWILQGFVRGEWDMVQPRSDEEAVDAWISAVQVCVLNDHSEILAFTEGTATAALERARRCGDVVRVARVSALRLLSRAAASDDLRVFAATEAAEFAEAERVGDGFALGIRALALGRWHVGVGGIALARATNDVPAVARTALEHLETAAQFLDRQGMDAWIVYARIQRVKALADLRELEQVDAHLKVLGEAIDRFPILTSHVYELVGQVRTVFQDERASDAFANALRAAKVSGLLGRVELLASYVGSPPAT